MKAFVIAMLLFITRALCAQNPSADDILRDADSLMNNYQFESALARLESSEDTVNINLLKRKGYCHSRLGNYSEAILAYERILKLDSTNREGLYHLGQLYSDTDEYQQAASCYQALIQLDSTNSLYYKQYAAAAARVNDIAVAIGSYFKAVQLNPRDLDGYAKFANLMMDAEQYEFVDSMLTNVLSTRENTQLRLLLARAKLGQDKHKEVVANVERILSTNDTTMTSVRMLGISYFHLEQYAKVIRCMQYLLRKEIKADWIYYFLGTSYQQVGDPIKAIEYLNLAVEEGISDNIGTYYTQLASAYEEARDFKNAIRNYKAAYETTRTDILLYHLARNYDVYYKDKTQAQIYYRKYLDSGDTIRLAQEYSRQRLNTLSASQ
jgi:tetratricopeptide (TPR) repeat protein